MLRVLILIPSALLLTAAAPDASSGDDKKSSEVVCKMQKRTGTRFATKICYTRAQWMQIAEQNKRDFAEARDRPVIDTTRDN